ncbi:hypothetical protein [Pseudomonas paraeruginosa]|uniref:hypothetical protein n=1 Tax=Pseudomonas paraeruginosa TaxID=2994495 RepID=UPI0039FD3D26|nr:hypothetical protein [Pseudomonas aeruginosa]HCF2413614.1 hypothetical protein [Pseudomonas aeruginosa]HCF2415630.1 hypothetical protein [Pseudomonas aeruginosa]
MAKPNNTSTPSVTERPSASSRCCPPRRPTGSHATATLYLDAQAPRGQLFESAKARLQSALSILAPTRLLDENEEPN